MHRSFGSNGYMAIRLLVLSSLIMSITVFSISCAGGAAAPTPTPTAPAKPVGKATPAAQASPAAPAKAVPGGNPDAGKQAVSTYGCGSCHTIPGVQGANGRSAPSLAGFANRQQIAGAVPNNPDNLVKWIQDPQSVKSNTAMPDLNVTEADAKNIAAYLYTLQ